MLGPFVQFVTLVLVIDDLTGTQHHATSPLDAWRHAIIGSVIP